MNTRKVKSGFMYDRGDDAAPAPATEAPRPSDEAHIVTDVDEALTRRLTAGRAVYGPLDLATDTRDFVEEAWEEGIDLLVYLAAARRVRDGLRAEVESQASAFTAARKLIERLWDALRQKTAEADNLRASTADLMAQRDDARRMVCDEWHDPEALARERGWVGLYPATKEAKP
jgi:hypothetical protein